MPDTLHDPDGIPHVLLGIGALTLTLIAALVLMLISGHASQHPGASLVLALGAPLLALLVTLAITRRRAAMSD